MQSFLGVKLISIVLELMRFILLFCFLFISFCLYCQNSVLLIEGGIGANRHEPRTAYSTIGTKIPLNRRINLFISNDFVFGQSDFKYSFFNKDDYSYKSRRYGFHGGIDYIPTPIKQLQNLKLGLGLKIGMTFYRSVLNTSNNELKEILLSSVERNNIEVRFLLHSQYR